MKKNQARALMAVPLILLLASVGCKKIGEQNQSPGTSTNKLTLSNKTNPLSVRNVKKAMDVIAKRTEQKGNIAEMGSAANKPTGAIPNSGNYPTYTILK